MLVDLSVAQRALAGYMSELSEAAYCAGWMDDLEYALWEAVRGERTSFGQLNFSEQHVRRLTELSASCDGWIFFDGENEETWLKADDWEQRFDTWQADGGSRRT